MKLKLNKAPYFMMNFSFEGFKQKFSERVSSLSLDETNLVVDKARKAIGAGSAIAHIGYVRSAPYTQEEQDAAKDYLYFRTKRRPMTLRSAEKHKPSSRPMRIPKEVRESLEEYDFE